MARSGKSRRLTVAVTGASGYVGTRLVHALARDDRIDRILGFDVVASPVNNAKFVFDVMDVRNEALEERLRGVDVLVHLAFVMDPIRDEAQMRDVNVNGSQNVFRCAGDAGVKKLIYTSSALVYGAHPDNPIPLTEEAPLRANLDFSYAAHKLEVEYVMREFQDDFPDVGVTVFRPAIIFGRHVDNAWSHALELPLLFRVQGHAPPLQFVHEDDVARALHFAIATDTSGVYNLAAPGWLEADQMLSLLGRRTMELPEPLAFALVDRMWSAGLAEAPAGLLHYVMHPWVVSIDKLTQAGFTPQHSNLDAFTETVEVTRERVRLGPARLRRSDLRRGAAAGLGLAALATIRSARRRRAA